MGYKRLCQDWRVAQSLTTSPVYARSPQDVYSEQRWSRVTGGQRQAQSLRRCDCQSGERTPGWGTPEREGVYRLTHRDVDGTTDVRFHTARQHERLTVRHP
jgi:hypothetical protein